jgi:thiopurine S-methyltransferase
MKADFWHQRWREGKIGFHLDETNPNLSEWFGSLGLQAGQRVFVPLSGKSVDMLWLAQQGMQVVGVEISELAIRSFFEENGLVPDVRNIRNHDHWQAGGIDLIHADFFDLHPADIGNVDAVYDRASLIALPPQMRAEYVAWLQQLVPHSVPQLLVTLDYRQEQMSGPPFAVSDAEVERLYATTHRIRKLSSVDILVRETHFRQKGLDELTENVYLLER